MHNYNVLWSNSQIVVFPLYFQKAQKIELSIFKLFMSRKYFCDCGSSLSATPHQCCQWGQNNKLINWSFFNSITAFLLFVISWLTRGRPYRLSGPRCSQRRRTVRSCLNGYLPHGSPRSAPVGGPISSLVCGTAGDQLMDRLVGTGPDYWRDGRLIGPDNNSFSYLRVLH